MEGESMLDREKNYARMQIHKVPDSFCKGFHYLQQKRTNSRLAIVRPVHLYGPLHWWPSLLGFVCLKLIDLLTEIYILLVLCTALTREERLERDMELHSSSGYTKREEQQVDESG